VRIFVLDHSALTALGTGNHILARLLYGAPRGAGSVVTPLHRGPRLLAPALCLLHAGRNSSHLADHVAELEPLHIAPFDTAAVIALCGPLADMTPHIGHAVHTAVRHDASIITTDPDTYPESIRTITLPTM
jgi:hypothetical protein